MSHGLLRNFIKNIFKVLESYWVEKFKNLITFFLTQYKLVESFFFDFLMVKKSSRFQAEKK